MDLLAPAASADEREIKPCARCVRARPKLEIRGYPWGDGKIRESNFGDGTSYSNKERERGEEEESIPSPRGETAAGGMIGHPHFNWVSTANQRLTVTLLCSAIF